MPAFHSERGSARNGRFPGAAAKACFAMLYQGFPINVRFPKGRNGDQQTVPCSTCPRTRECLFYQWFPRSAIADLSRVVRPRIGTFLGSRTPPCSKRCFTNGFCMVLNKRKIPGLVFFLGRAEMMVFHWFYKGLSTVAGACFFLGIWRLRVVLADLQACYMHFKCI